MKITLAVARRVLEPLYPLVSYAIVLSLLVLFVQTWNSEKCILLGWKTNLFSFQCCFLLRTTPANKNTILLPFLLCLSWLFLVAQQCSVFFAGQLPFKLPNCAQKWLISSVNTAETVFFIFCLYTVCFILVRTFKSSMSRSNNGTRKKTFKHSHLSWSSAILYQLPPSTAVHSILPVQFTCLTVFLHNLCPSPLGLLIGLEPCTLYSIHFFTQSLSSFCNTCPYHHNLFCCSTEIVIYF